MITHKECIFTGIEAEGTDRGIHTLFVSGRNHSVLDVLLNLEANHIQRIYFGAGEVFGIPTGMINEPNRWKTLLETYKCFVEINSEKLYQEIPQCCFEWGLKVIWVQKIKNIDILEDKPIHTLKFVSSKQIRWMDCVLTQKITDVFDPLYQQDKQII